MSGVHTKLAPCFLDLRSLLLLSAGCLAAGCGGLEGGSDGDDRPECPYAVHPDDDRRKVSSFEAQSVATGNYHSCAIQTDGYPRCWGLGDNGLRKVDPKDYDQSITPHVEMTDITVGLQHTCGLDSDGRVRCWGRTTGPPDDVRTELRFSQLEAHGNHHCGIEKGTGTIHCWGSSNGSVPEGTFDDLAVGLKHLCALRQDGSIVCTGHGSDPDKREAPEDLDYDQAVPPDDGPFRSVSAGSHTNCALREDGTAECWGHGSNPDRSEADADYGQAVAPEGTFEAVDAGGFYSCGIRPDGSLECWGDHCGVWGRPALRPPEGTFRSVAVGDWYACALRDDRRVVCWGMGADDTLNEGREASDVYDYDQAHPP